MNTPAWPKPSQIKREKPWFKEYPDGRIVYVMTTKKGRDAYAANVRAMYLRQGKQCGLKISSMCKAKDGRLQLEFAQFDHDSGRGHGGAKRDDRIEKDGKPINSAVCPWCNSLKGSRPRSSFELTDLVP